MKRYKPFKFKEDNIKQEAFAWLNKFMLTSKTSMPSKAVINFLQTYAQKVNTIYRGIGVVWPRVDKSKVDDINNLKTGDLLPSYLSRPTGVSSYTKKLGLAKSYSKGKVSIMVEATPSDKSIVLDLEQFAKQLKKDNETFFDKEDLQYMIKDKEVIILEPIKSTIIDIKGKL